MTKEQENWIKYIVVGGDRFISSKKEFLDYRKTLKKTFTFINSFLKEKEDYSYINDITYDKYLEWHKEYHEFIYNNWSKLIININKVVSVYFENNIEKKYTAQEIKKILIDNKIYNEVKGFGGINND